MANEPTQVHAIETTGEGRDYQSYRSYRAGFVSEELKATKELYEKIDSDDGKDRSKALNECRLYSFFARNVETNRVHVISNSCRLRWCPICSTGRTGYIIHNLTPWMKKIKVPRFMTLTMKHSNDSLSEQIGTLYRNFRTLRKHKWFRKYVRGGVWFFQVKLSVNGEQWHPHLHCIIQGDYIPKMELSKRWEQITGDSKIVDVKLVRDTENTAGYVARYSARPAQLSKYPNELRVEIFIAMHGRRLAGSWGTARGVSLSPPTKVDSDKYVRIGSWSTVLALRETNDDAKSIFKAWSMNTDLDPKVTCQWADDFIDNKPFQDGYVTDKYVEPYLDGF